MDNPALWIATFGLLLNVLVFFFARKRESSEDIDKREAEVRAHIGRLHESVDSRIATAFGKLDTLRAEMSDFKLDSARHMATKEDVRSAVHDLTQRLGSFEGKVDTILDAITTLRERTAARNAKQD